MVQQLAHLRITNQFSFPQMRPTTGINTKIGSIAEAEAGTVGLLEERTDMINTDGSAFAVGLDPPWLLVIH